MYILTTQFCLSFRVLREITFPEKKSRNVNYMLILVSLLGKNIPRDKAER